MKKRIVLIITLIVLPFILTGCDLFKNINKLQEESYPKVKEYNYNEKELICDFKNSIISNNLNAQSTIVFYFDNSGIVTSATYKDEFLKENSNNELYESLKNNCNNQKCTAQYQNGQIIIQGILDSNDITELNWHNKNKNELKSVIEETQKDILINCK